MATALRLALGGLATAALLWVAFVGTSDVYAADDDFRLVPAESSVQFLGIKNDSVAIGGHFVGLTGGVNTALGSAWLNVHVSSVQTGDAERDKNIITHFFQADEFPAAHLEISGLPASLEVLDVGSSAEINVKGTLSMHGRTVDLEFPVRMTRETVGYRVATARALVIDAAAFGMEAQVATLKAVCGHLSLDSVFPVEASLLFRK